MYNAVLLLGSNLGNSKKILTDARTEIENKAGKIQLKSNLYQTSAWGFKNQPDFLNQIICLNTALRPEQLLNVINKIEIKLGRISREKWHAREIDIDILFYDKEIIDLKFLIIPHPQMTMRKFTMVPLVEIMPDFLHPVLKKTMKQLLSECKDEEQVILIH